MTNSSVYLDPNSVTDESQWRDLHEHMQDMLAGYLDKALDQEEIALVEAHLSGCRDCRSDLARQNLLQVQLKRQFEHFVSEPMSTELQCKLDNIANHDVTEQSISSSDVPFEKIGRYQDEPSQLADFLKKLFLFFADPKVSFSGWATALVMFTFLWLPQASFNLQSRIPMIEDALIQYQNMQTQALPQTLDIKQPVKMAAWSDSQLVASWNTQIGGAPATVYATRSGKDIVLQYQIDEKVFYRNPEVRTAVANSGSFIYHKDSIQVIALPSNDTCLLIVGPAKALPNVNAIKFI